jgi:hypothetical protein
METLISYLIRSILISGLMLGYYLAVFRNRKLHSFNRVWLLTALMAGLALPLIPMKWLTWHTAARPFVVLVGGTDPHPTAVGAFPVMAVAVAVCISVSLLLLAILGFRIIRVYRLKRGHQTQRIEGCLLIEVLDRRAPFSFLKYLFWQEGANIQDPYNRKVLDHELAHIRGGHTYDNLFAQTLAAIFWMNPFYWLIRGELQMVHEFIADDASIASGDTETFAQMLLRAYDDGRYLDPSHNFFHSPIKRRLLMISSSKTPSTLRAALALPALLAMIAIACSKEQSTPAQQTKQLNKDIVILGKIRKDSVFRLKAQTLKIAWITKDGKNGRGVVRFGADSVREKIQLDYLEQPVTIVGKIVDDKVPPPPPLKLGPQNN